MSDAPSGTTIQEDWGVYYESKDGKKKGWMQTAGSGVWLFGSQKRAQDYCMTDEYRPRRINLVAVDD